MEEEGKELAMNSGRNASGSLGLQALQSRPNKARLGNFYAPSCLIKSGNRVPRGFKAPCFLRVLWNLNFPQN